MNHSAGVGKARLTLYSFKGKPVFNLLLKRLQIEVFIRPDIEITPQLSQEVRFFLAPRIAILVFLTSLHTSINLKLWFRALID